jgi:mycothiol synthase
VVVAWQMRLRPPVLDDAAAVLTVLTARDRADLGAADHQLASLVASWRTPAVDLCADARVVELGGEVVAYGIVQRSGSMAVVSPDREGAGIGSRLLRWTQERERQRGGTSHRQWVAGGNWSAAMLLTGSGYVRVRSYFRMSRRLGVPGHHDPVAGALAGPEPAVIRALDIDRDAEALHALDAASFAGAADYEPQPLDEFVAEHLRAADLERGLSWVADCHGRVAGFMLGHRWEPARVGFVDLLAVHPAEQGRGIGMALLRAAFDGFTAEGLGEVQLGVASDNPGALRLYDRAGMTPRFRFDVYERPLTA